MRSLHPRSALTVFAAFFVALGITLGLGLATVAALLNSVAHAVPPR